MDSPINILVIPDAHASPKHNNSRFDLLGKHIVETQPEVIVCIGDFADMESLCSYDKGKKSFEGRRYKKDVEVTIDAQNRMFAPLKEYNKRMKETKHKQYKPRLIMCMGNHDEARINRLVSSQAELEGIVSLKDLKFEEFGWEVVPFLEPIIVNGVAFAHYFTTGIMGKAISGEHPAYTMISKMHMSCVAGHSHIRSFAERTAADGRRLVGMVVGCFLDEDQHEEYAGQANKMWWRGLVTMKDVQNGEYEPEFINIKQLKKKYA